MTHTDRPLISSGVLLGIGLGGFIDGILFHQIFQLHNMLSNRLFPGSVVNLEINMFWDGLFHAFTWLMTVIGLWLLWKAGGRKDVAWDGRVFGGSLLLGWGLFNFIEGIINHHILAIHHVVQRAEGATQAFWDLAFLASGIILIMMGMGLIKSKASEDRSHLPRRVSPTRSPA